MKGGCQSGRKVVPHDSKSDLPLEFLNLMSFLGEKKLEKKTLKELEANHS